MNLSEQAYHDYPAWSYSLIAKYARNGFSAIATLHDKMKPTPEMEFGSLFDSILTKGRRCSSSSTGCAKCATAICRATTSWWASR